MTNRYYVRSKFFPYMGVGNPTIASGRDLNSSKYIENINMNISSIIIKSLNPFAKSHEEPYIYDVQSECIHNNVENVTTKFVPAVTCSISQFDTTSNVIDNSSPVILDVSSGEYCTLYDTVSNDNYELPLVTESDSINSLPRKYV